MENHATAHIGFLRAEFFIPHAQSLKEKRSVLRRLRDRVHNEFNVSAAEIGYQDKWQRSQWGFCLVSSDAGCLDSAMEKLLDFLRAGRDADLTDYEIEVL